MLPIKNPGHIVKNVSLYWCGIFLDSVLDLMQLFIIHIRIYDQIFLFSGSCLFTFNSVCLNILTRSFNKLNCGNSTKWIEPYVSLTETNK